jgi:hypothetical protein
MEVGTMQTLTRKDVTAALGDLDDITIVEILNSGATIDELAEAQAWLANDEPLMNIGKPLAAGRVGRLVELLKSVEADEPAPLGHEV